MEGGKLKMEGGKVTKWGEDFFGKKSGKMILPIQKNFPVSPPSSYKKIRIKNGIIYKLYPTFGNGRVTTKNTGAHAETRYDITSILEVGWSLEIHLNHFSWFKKSNLHVHGKCKPCKLKRTTFLFLITYQHSSIWTSSVTLEPALLVTSAVIVSYATQASNFVFWKLGALRPLGWGHL